MFWAKTLIESVDEEYLSCELQFKIFGNMSQNLWPNMLHFFFHKWAIWANRKKSLFPKIKF